MTRRWGRDPFPTGLVQAVEGAARQATASSTTPGLSVALVHCGQQVWAAGYGLADRATGLALLQCGKSVHSEAATRL